MDDHNPDRKHPFTAPGLHPLPDGQTADIMAGSRAAIPPPDPGSGSAGAFGRNAVPARLPTCGVADGLRQRAIEASVTRGRCDGRAKGRTIHSWRRTPPPEPR